MLDILGGLADQCFSIEKLYIKLCCIYFFPVIIVRQDL
jgi:hypothetical protein